MGVSTRMDGVEVVDSSGLGTCKRVEVGYEDCLSKSRRLKVCTKIYIN